MFEQPSLIPLDNIPTKHPEKPEGFDRVRQVKHHSKTYYSLVDIVEIFSDTSSANRYWSDTKKRLEKDGFQLYENIVQLKLPSTDGKKYATDCANLEICLRIIQSIPSPKAEIVRRYMAWLLAQEIEKSLKGGVPFPQTYEYRRLIDAGYNHQQAMNWHSYREQVKETTKEVNSIRMQRGATGEQLGQLENEDLYNVTGKTAKGLRKEGELAKSDATRDYLSEADLALLNFSKSLAGGQHITNDSRGINELTEDTRRVRPVIHAALEKIKELGLQTARRLKAPKKPTQPPLLPSGDE